MHETMTEHNAADALHSVTEDFVSHLESFIHGGLLVRSLEEREELFVFDNDNRVHAFAEFSNTPLRDGHTSVTFETERLGHHGNREDAQFASDIRHDRSCTRTRTTAHTGSDEHHVGALHAFLDFVNVFFGSLTTDFRIHAGTQIPCGLFANQNFAVGKAQVKSHGIGINVVVFHAFDVHIHHTVHSIAAGTADAEHLNLGVVVGWFLAHDARLYLEVDFVDFTHVIYLPDSECWFLL